MDLYTSANHFVVRRIGLGRGTTAHWTKRRPKNLIIFVHGFSGTAEGTWLDVAAELRSRDEFRETDILFVGYNSLKSRALISARLVGEIIKDFVESPEKLFNKHMYYIAKRSASEYDQVTILCHSLGAAIMRRVAVDFVKSSNIRLSNVHLVLFAPAHKGATMHSYLENIARRGRGAGFLPLIRNVLFWRRQVFHDLGTHCRFITSLERDTRLAIKEFGQRTILIADSVYFGEFEDIVQVEDFAMDPQFTPLFGRNHTNLVKTTPQIRHVIDVCKRVAL